MESATKMDDEDGTSDDGEDDDGDEDNQVDDQDEEAEEEQPVKTYKPVTKADKERAQLLLNHKKRRIYKAVVARETRENAEKARLAAKASGKVSKAGAKDSARRR
ncbi:hypothetical protein GNI_092290 [Gregarina niphandrodes]|uniref:Uncharacterized protein n=1 Tax=Gregarina niphandrodes TaxID=110365 RepID=A0A023B5C4_GRENI|nr:hypothetical protein GNI_092290 [Gregarina niphandrodes]EZG59487.1 hypothetical protein GNI_092290 [Gregarina niphandrodes]|eukprot:XP_011130890.1 hypothetical protein GNI_092290 [Gregarina niphandrodes]